MFHSLTWVEMIFYTDFSFTSFTVLFMNILATVSHISSRHYTLKFQDQVPKLFLDLPLCPLLRSIASSAFPLFMHLINIWMLHAHALSSSTYVSGNIYKVEHILCHGTLINNNHPTSNKEGKWWTERRKKKVSSFLSAWVSVSDCYTECFILLWHNYYAINKWLHCITWWIIKSINFLHSHVPVIMQ